ncbi:MAG TPA: hypothetical protein VMG82_32655, partial [Candidatus Sulfotelmatobacter sp.]|nr:hypothetical protein [Candidatus Sulfotelmatobacter sp.]
MNRIATLCCTLLILASAAPCQIQPTFFSMGVSSTADMPKVSYGTISHPPAGWTTIEGAGRGVYTFRAMDQFVKNAPKDANGVAQLVIDLGGWTPGWAVADHTGCITNKLKVVACTIPPDNIQDWIDYVYTVVNHYNGKTAPHVKCYEIWVEASNPEFWTGTTAQMLPLAQAAYTAAKRDPYAEVLTPSVVWSNGVRWMTNYLKLGGGTYADGLSFHGYPSETGKGRVRPVPLPESPASTNAPIMTMITTFRGLADTYGMLGKPIMTTEGGWGVNGVSDSDMQTAWITHFEVLQAGLAAANNLQFQTWYSWGELALSGTIETKTGTPTPAGYAYDVVQGWLVGQQPQPCTSSGNIWSCTVGANVIVWDTSQSCSAGLCTSSTYSAPSGYTQYVDV